MRYCRIEVERLANLDGKVLDPLTGVVWLDFRHGDFLTQGVLMNIVGHERNWESPVLSLLVDRRCKASLDSVPKIRSIFIRLWSLT